MGDIFSTPSQPSPNSSARESPQPKPDMVPKSPESENPSTDPPAETEKVENSPEERSPLEEVPEEAIGEGDGDGGEEGEEEEGECGFCLFMKGGGCREAFINWEKCVEDGEKNKEDIVEKCFRATDALKKCMEAHSDYYEPLLQAEKDAEAEVAKQLEEDKLAGKDAGAVETEKNNQNEDVSESPEKGEAS